MPTLYICNVQASVNATYFWPVRPIQVDQCSELPVLTFAPIRAR